MKDYLCDICNKRHEVYYGSDCPWAGAVNDLKGENPERKFEKLSDSIYVLNNQEVYINGDLEVELDFEKGSLFHRLWVVVGVEEFRSSIQGLASEQRVILKGKIVSENPLLEQCEGLETELHFGIGECFLKVTQQSQLKSDQSAPISLRRFIDTMQRIHHPELWEASIIHTESFQKRLIRVLKDAFQKNGSFSINISNNREVLFQLISGELLESPRANEIGLHISNDETNSNYDQVKDEMNVLFNELEFEFIRLDGIDTYQIPYKYKDKHMFDNIHQVIKNVYKEDTEKCDVDLIDL